MKNKINVPFYRKVNPFDCSCAPVCLQMALAYYGRQKLIDEIYELCESIGRVHYTLPWGICLGAANEGLYATFISKKPFELLPMSRKDISNLTGKSVSEIERIEKNQISRCKENDYIELVEWQDHFKKIPEIFASGEKKGIVIPTVWWGARPHNIVLVNYMNPGIQSGRKNRPQGSKNVYYHDPDSHGTLQTMTEEVFFNKWLHPNTDNDLLIISDKKLKIKK